MYHKINAFKDNWQLVPPGGDLPRRLRWPWILLPLGISMGSCTNYWLDPKDNGQTVGEEVDDTKPEDTRPVADAGRDFGVFLLPDAYATLNGSGSYGQNELEIAAYQWTQVSGPGDCVLADADKAIATASGLQEGKYVFRLTVTNTIGEERSSEVTVSVRQPGESYIPPVAPGQPPEKIKYSVMRFGNVNCASLDSSKLHVTVYESYKEFLGGIKIDLSYFYEKYQEQYGEAPEKIVFRFGEITLDQLKAFSVSLLDSTSKDQEEPDVAHMISAKLKDADTLARSGITLNENDQTVTLDLRQRKVEWDNIMRDAGDESIANDASYIDNVVINADGGFSFSAAARPAHLTGWAFAGLYEQNKFDLNNGTFNYNLQGFVPPAYAQPDPDYPETGRRIIFSRGKKENGDYAELVYDPTGFPADDGAAGIPVTHLHENYLSVRDATAETLGHNDLRLHLAKQGSRVMIGDTTEQKFSFSIANENPATGLSYLKFKVKNYAGFSKEDFLAKVSVGLKLNINSASDYHQILTQNYMNYILCTPAGGYHEFSLPLWFLENITYGTVHELDGIFFGSIDGSLSDIEVSDLEVSIINQTPYPLSIEKVDRTGFTGFGVALDNKNAQGKITLSGLKAGDKEIKADGKKSELDSKAQALTWTVFTGYYPNDDYEQPFVSTGRIIYTMESTQGVFIGEL